MPIEERPVRKVIADLPDFLVVFDNATQCIITPDKTYGQRGLYPFSKDIVEKWPWVVQHEDIVIVANQLVFLVVHEEHFMPGISTLFCVYRGMRS